MVKIQMRRSELGQKNNSFTPTNNSVNTNRSEDIDKDELRHGSVKQWIAMHCGKHAGDIKSARAAYISI